MGMFDTVNCCLCNNREYNDFNISNFIKEKQRMKSYKDMSYSELIKEYNRVSELLQNNHHPFTQKQNKVYLKKVEARINEFSR